MNTMYVVMFYSLYCHANLVNKILLPILHLFQRLKAITAQKQILCSSVRKRVSLALPCWTLAFTTNMVLCAQHQRFDVYCAARRKKR